MKESYSVNLSGYNLKGENLLNGSGVYCVYRCVDNGDTVSIKELIYIGESSNVADRVSCHEKLPDWKRRLQHGETLCYSSGAVNSYDRVRVEAAMINKHKPVVNVEYKNSFPFDETTISLSGKTALLDTYFTVRKTVTASLYY